MKLGILVFLPLGTKITGGPALLINFIMMSLPLLFLYFFPAFVFLACLQNIRIPLLPSC